MMKHNRIAQTIWLICILIILPVLSSAEGKDPIWDQDQVSNATVLLYQPKGDSGSGTVIVKSSRFYLLTASHVAKGLKNDSKVILRLKGDKPGIFDLLPLTKNKSLNWKHHSVADIAMIELDSKNGSVKTLLESYAFPFELIHNGKDLPTYGADLTFLGYPVVDMKMEHFSPLIFTAYLASGLITQERGDTKTKCDVFYLNQPSIQGCSGSAVFFSVKKSTIYMAGKATLIIGIMHGTFSDNTGGKLAMVTPSYYISDLFKE
jgi:hypothetical protein